MLAAQLVPLSAATLALISPRAVDIHRQYDIAAAVGSRSTFAISLMPPRTAIALALFAGFALLLLGSARMLSNRSVRQLAAGLALAGVVLSLVGIIQRATFNGQIYGVWPLVQGGSPFGPFINRNHFAGWILMVLPLTVGLLGSILSREMVGVRPDFRSRVLWFSSDSASRAILVAFAILAMSLALVLTLSRSGIASMAVALVCTSLVMARTRDTGRRPVRHVIPLCAAAAVLAAIASVGVDRIATRFAVAGPLDMESRQAIWADTLRMIEHFWLTGTGVNTFGTAALFYQVRLKGTHMQEAHNDYLQIIAEGGFVMAALVAVAIVLLAINIRRRLREDVGSIWWIRVGAIGGLVAIATQSLVEFSLQIPANAALFAVVCGVALHDGRRARSQVAPLPPKPSLPATNERPANVTTFGAPDPDLTFAADVSRRDDLGRTELDLSELDDAPTPARLRRLGQNGIRTPIRQSSTDDPRTIALIAALAIIFFALTVLGLWQG